ncbi:hypothetical protein ABJI51_03440 [Amycolatopsis sp. NEAU-NG30]|uniref:DUF7878 domain-containing protein n=1 Tax=Amycolatopsis melonis TaxID=3156488 RepID=A0ABV0L827_9PSEU
MNEVLQMQLSYSALTAADLLGRSRTEVFVNVEADLVVLDGDREVLREGAFPVVELASALRRWKARGVAGRGDFEFTSLSLESRWRVRLVEADGGWRVVDDDGFTGAVRPAGEVDAAIDDFTTRLRGDCTRLLGSWIEQYLD